MKPIKNISWLSFLICLMMQTGCGTLRTYPGESLPKDTVATFYCPAFMGSVVVEYIDDTSVGLHSSIEILPGLHTVTYRTGTPYESVEGSIIFEAEAGHQYTLLVVKTIEPGRFKADVVEVYEQE